MIKDMSKSKNKSKNYISFFLKKIVDDFFDICSDSDVFKKKLVIHMMGKSLFRNKILKEMRGKIKF